MEEGGTRSRPRETGFRGSGCGGGDAYRANDDVKTEALADGGEQAAERNKLPGEARGD